MLAVAAVAESAFADPPTGYLDALDEAGVARGWALDPAHPDRSIEVELYVDRSAPPSEPVARADAEMARPDVNAVKRVPGNHGFTGNIPPAFRDGKPHQLSVYGVSVDGTTAELAGSPKTFTLARPAGLPTKGDASITRNGITIGTEARFAGAVSSLRWHGMEFVDTQDHGREIQTAWQGNDAGECYNPTEAGSARDATGLSTTSEVLSATASDASITVVSHPAFWLQPGEKSRWCRFTRRGGSDPWLGGTALNRQPIDADTLKKTVTLGYKDLGNVVVYQSEITFAAAELAEFPLRYVIVENPATYLRHRFNHVWRWDVGSAALTGPRPASAHFAEYSPAPVIAGTADRRYALGLFTPDIPRTGFVGADQEIYAGYGFTDWESTVSINARIVARPPTGDHFTPGTYKFTTFLAIGTVEEVAETLRRLAALMPAPVPGTAE